jgi:hypothetical protein
MSIPIRVPLIVGALLLRVFSAQADAAAFPLHDSSINTGSAVAAPGPYDPADPYFAPNGFLDPVWYQLRSAIS